MNGLLLLASALCAFTFCVHTFAGARFVVRPLVDSEVDPFAKATLRVVWHMVTWSLACLGLVLGWAAISGSVDVALVGTALSAGYAFIFFVVAQVTFRAAIRLPQWILFGAITLYAAAGAAGTRADLVTAIMLVAIAVLHVAWAAGASWPAADRKALMRVVIASKRAMPSSGPCLVVAVGLVAMAGALVFGHSRWVHLAIAGIFIARGTLGFFERWLRPSIRGTPYASVSTFMYTPLALSLGVAALLGS